MGGGMAAMGCAICGSAAGMEGASPPIRRAGCGGYQVRALADRGLTRDLIDIHAAAERWTHIDLEEFGRRHARGEFDLADLQARLAGADWIDDSEFAAYGLNEVDTAELRAWAQTWADDIAQRLHQQEPFEES